MLRIVALSLAVVVSLPSFALASSRRQAPAEPDPAEAARAEREKKALALLDQVVETARKLRLPENRVGVQIRAVNLLWPRDEARARALVRETFGSINEML